MFCTSTIMFIISWNGHHARNGILFNKTYNVNARNSTSVIIFQIDSSSIMVRKECNSWNLILDSLQTFVLDLRGVFCSYIFTLTMFFLILFFHVILLLSFLWINKIPDILPYGEFSNNFIMLVIVGDLPHGNLSIFRHFFHTSPLTPYITLSPLTSYCNVYPYNDLIFVH